MKRRLMRIISFMKGLVILAKPNVYLGWLSHPLLLISNTLSLAKWVSKQDKSSVYNDFYSAKRDYSKRFKVYQYVVDKFDLGNEPLDYLEFGVCGGYSFRWWISNCINENSSFFGFDTFEGLPEKWGTFSKGDMAADIPIVDDNRVEFVKGLFQDTIPGFLVDHNLRNGKRKILHLDADLFTSTLFSLTSLAPYLNKGDILIFDEFNVPNHEFFAFKIFSESYYIKTRLICAVNNYYQVALIIE